MRQILTIFLCSLHLLLIVSVTCIHGKTAHMCAHIEKRHFDTDSS